MKELSLRQIQEETLELLVEFDEICRMVDARYFLAWGTLIGAIRHEGFIPWDDDLDVTMFPDDYKKILAYFDEKKNNELELHDIYNQPNCYFNITRICEKKHRLVFDDLDYTSGLFIDIYILHGMGNDCDLEYWKKRFKNYVRWQKGVFVSLSNSLFYGKNYLNKVLNIPFVLFSKFVGKQYYIKKFDSYKRFDISNSKYIGVPQWEAEIFLKEDFEEIVYVSFEGLSVPVPKGFHSHLSMVYGDYLKMPDEKDRIPQHGYKAYSLIEE